MSRDPYKYFRIETGELLDTLSGGVLKLEGGLCDAELVSTLLRMAHTLKGAARVVRQPPIAELAHRLEDALVPHRKAEAPVPREAAAGMLSLIDEIRARVAALGATETPEVRQAAPRAVETPFETVRLELGEVDALLDGLAETSVALDGVRQQAGRVEPIRKLASQLVDLLGRARQEPSVTRARAAAQELKASLEKLDAGLGAAAGRVERELSGTQDVAGRLRLVPAKAILSGLERAARDTAQQVGKEVLFRFTGGELRCDAHVLEALREAMLHAVRNAIVHGIEPAAARAAMGKPPAGTVAIRVEKHANRVRIACEDDGRGIDVAAVRRSAQERGLDVADPFGMPEAIALLLGGGVSTTGAVTETSGRGLGLEIAARTASKLKGEASVRSFPGRGTSVELTVPVSLVSLEVLWVECGGQWLSLPLESVRQAMRIGQADVAVTGAGEALLFDGKPVPLRSLGQLLGHGGPSRGAQAMRSVLLLGAGSGHAAVSVDRILGTGTVMARALPASIGSEPLFAGASLDEAGDPRLLLDPVAIVSAAGVASAIESETFHPAEKPARACVLIVDDSLTTRMLEQSILEAAGFEVELACSGEEGLARARERQHALFLVDIEMPGISGFEFVERIQADAALRRTPAILVSSRNSPEDRARGQRAGAMAYVDKNEFDQVGLLSLIRRLVAAS